MAVSGEIVVNDSEFNATVKMSLNAAKNNIAEVKCTLVDYKSVSKAMDAFKNKAKEFEALVDKYKQFLDSDLKKLYKAEMQYALQDKESSKHTNH